MNYYNILYEKGFLDPDSDKYIWISNMNFFQKEKFNYYLTEIYEDMIDVIPFAKTSNGDIFGWYNPDGIQSEIIVMCNHDDGESLFYAPDLCAAIFRRILEFVNEEEFSEKKSENCMSLKELRDVLLNYIQAFTPYFSVNYIAILNELVTKPLKLIDDGCGYKYYALLTNEEVEEILINNISFEQLNKEFNCYEN